MSKYKIRPLGERVVIKKADAKEVSEGGIYLPKEMEQNENTYIGTVLAVGENTGVAVGDEVIYKRFSGVEVRVEDEPVIVININEVLAVFNS